MTRTIISPSDLAQRTREILARVHEGELAIVASGGEERIVLLDALDYRLLRALAGNRLLYRDGHPIAVLEGREPRFLVNLDAATRWQAQNALVRRSVAPKLKAYLGRSA